MRDVHAAPVTTTVDARLIAEGRRWDDRLAHAAGVGRVPDIERAAWRSAVDPFGTGVWERRIAWNGLGSAGPAQPGTDGWRDELARLRSGLLRRGPAIRPEAEVAFAHLLQPLADTAWEPLAVVADAAGVTEQARAQLRAALVHRLSETAARALGERFVGDRTLTDVVLARACDGTVPGSSTAGYDRFCRKQAVTGLADVFEAFPVLGRLLATVTQHWRTGTGEMLGRVTDDRTLLERSFGVRAGAAITTVATGLSDPHRGGRGVAILEFADGTRVVYKPRSVAVERHFQTLVGTVERALPGAALRQLTVVCRGDYGYVEHVAAQPATGPDALRRFYRNAGRTLGLLYLLGATDCHWENMIAADDQLVLIDAETLFEGVPRPSDLERAERSQSKVADRIDGSVLRIGMVPTWISVGPARAVDISALGAPEGGGVREPQPGWCFVNSDDMVWGEREIERPHPACLPVAPDMPNPLTAHGEDLVRGLEDVLRVLQKPAVRARVTTALERFRGARRRVVVRATRTYTVLQRDALSPAALRSADARAVHLDRITRAYAVEVQRPQSWPLAAHEIAGLEDLDIPYFEGIVGLPSLLVGDRVVIDSYYEREGLTESLARLDALTPAEAAWQVRLVRGALAAHRFEMGRYPVATCRAARADGPLHGPAEVVRVLREDMLTDPIGPPSWLTVSLLADATRVQLGLIPHGLYDGRAGIAAFLFDAGEPDLATAVLRPVVDALDDADATRVRLYVQSTGPGLSGIGGLLRLYVHRAERDPGGEWTDRVTRATAALADDVLGAADACDLVSGLAGLAAPVAWLHRQRPSDVSERVLRTVGTLLVERQHSSGGWPLTPGQAPLAGLSHGASGVAAALADIAEALDDVTFADAAARGTRFEAELFDPSQRNWPDLRTGMRSSGTTWMRSWCHGSVGVALARLRLIERLGSHPEVDRWRDELDVAVEGSIAAQPTPTDHLCCGDLGRGVTVALAGQKTANPLWRQEGERICRAVVAKAAGSAENYRLLMGIDGTSGLRLPGLMTGLAGIGMYVAHGSDLDWAQRLLI